MADAGWTIGVKWSGQKIDISGLQAGTTVSELKQAIQAQTGVLPERQKLLGVRFPHKTDVDVLTLLELGIKNGSKIMMMGSREETIAAAQEVPADSSDVVDDFDIKFDDIPIQSRQEFLAKVDRRVKDYPIKILNEPRPGKKLLVLDVDGTLFDNWSVGEKGGDLMRPYLHEFLTEMYPHYDLMIWSATNMKWIEAKLSLLGVSSNDAYKFVCYLDSRALISVETPERGLVDTKPLGVIWGKFPGVYTASNTIIVDDCRHNFLMNPRNGVRVRCFRDAHTNQATDRELVELCAYLMGLVGVASLEEVEHSGWRRKRNSLKKW